jgi:formate dehydrogenase major subunit
MPQAGTDSLADYVQGNRSQGGFWANLGAYTVSLLKSWWGDAATVHNDYCFDRIPRLTGDHSVFQHMLGMLDGTVRGYFLLGENPAVGSPASKVHRQALAKLDWLVVRDLVEIESATFWRDAPEVSSGELDPALCGTEVFLLPAASHVEKDGTFTNTQRLLQWHHQAVEPPGDARSDLWFAYHLGRRIRARLADSGLDRDRGVLDLTWDYPTHGPFDEPSAAAVLQEVNGYGPDGTPLSAFTELRDDGSTRCGCWIYCGCYADGVNQTTRRVPGTEQSWVAPEWGWAWPANRRMLYNRASADPDGRPWSERKAYVWWDADEGRWTGHDVPDFPLTKSPDYVPSSDATGPDALSGHDPFIMQDDGKGWLYVPVGLRDGPLPTHNEPQESPLRNPLYGQQSNPAMQRVGESVVPFNPDGDEFPYVVTSYRLTEHHTAGGMTRTVGHLNDLQPEMFCEVGPLLALERGLEHGGWATIRTARAEIEARVMVTERVGPITIDGRQIHQVGLPYHWGYSGPATGDSANDLFHLALDPNVHIEEVKAATCDVRPGRRRRGRRP